MKQVDISDVKNDFSYRSYLPKWLTEYEVLIKTKRGNKYYITTAVSFVGSWRIRGFDKAKVVGWRELKISKTVPMP